MYILYPPWSAVACDFDKGDRLEMAKNPTKLKEGGRLRAGGARRDTMKSEVWVQRWAVADWNEVDETNTRKTKKAKKLQKEVDDE